MRDFMILILLLSSFGFAKISSAAISSTCEAQQMESEKKAESQEELECQKFVTDATRAISLLAPLGATPQMLLCRRNTAGDRLDNPGASSQRIVHKLDNVSRARIRNLNQSVFGIPGVCVSAIAGHVVSKTIITMKPSTNFHG